MNMRASNIPTGVLDPGDVQEMIECPVCGGSGEDMRLYDCEFCDGMCEITKQEYEQYKAKD